MIYIPPTLCAPHESNIKYVGLILLIHFSRMVFSFFGVAAKQNLLVTVELNLVDVVAGLLLIAKD